MSNANQTVTRSFPTASILGLIFVTLKLTGYITWSWWWVLAPFWIPLAVFVAFLVILLTFAFIAFLIAKGK